jgi:hypothetical protein
VALPVGWWLYAKYGKVGWSEFLMAWLAGYFALILPTMGIVVLFHHLRPHLFEAREGVDELDVVIHVAMLSLSLGALFAVVFR